MKLIHGKDGVEANPCGFRCNFKTESGEICGETFETQWGLVKHKTQQGHKKERKKLTEN